MKIISKFHDYYDSASVFYDNSLVFKRENKRLNLEDCANIKIPFYAVELMSAHEDLNTTTEASVNFLYFCGKIYPIYELKKYITLVEKKDGFIQRYKKDQESNYFSSLKELTDVAIEKGLRKSFSLNNESKNIEYILEKIKDYEVNADVFRELKAPYFMIENKKIIEINPVLKKYTKSFKMEAPILYQEIEMYMSGVLGMEEKEIIIVSDKDKRDSKGFDNYSFKKRKL